MLDFDLVLEEIGELGKFQILNFFLLGIPTIFSSANSMTYIFTAGVPNYRCHIEDCDDSQDASYMEPWIQNAIPDASKNGGKYIPADCETYVPYANLTQGSCNEEGFYRNETQRCNRWVFEDNERTIVGEWNITCTENHWKLAMVGTVHFLGIFLGTSIFGFLSDRFGRKKVFLTCIALMSLTGIAQAAVKDYATFQVFVFINAFATSGVYPQAFIMALEVVGRKHRDLGGVFLNVLSAFGEAAVGLVAWFTKDWVTIQLVASVPPLFCLIYAKMVPESIRWLLAKKQADKAAVIMKYAAKVNGVELSNNLQAVIKVEVTDNKDDAELGKEEPSTWGTMKELLASRILVLRTLFLFYIWAAIAFIYYGLSVNSTSLGGNKYLNFSLVSLVEVPGYILSWLTMNKLGRRWSFAGSLFLCSTTCIAAAFVPEDLKSAVIFLFLLGKLGVTISFGVAFTYTAELFPTVIRSIGVGACSTIGRLGAISAPFAPLLSVYVKPLPLFVFGAAALLAGIFTLALPETLGTRLPTTVKEAEILTIEDDPKGHKEKSKRKHAKEQE